MVKCFPVVTLESLKEYRPHHIVYQYFPPNLRLIYGAHRKEWREHTLVTFVAEPKDGSQELVLIKFRSSKFITFRWEGDNALTYGDTGLCFELLIHFSYGWYVDLSSLTLSLFLFFYYGALLRFIIEDLTHIFPETDDRRISSMELWLKTTESEWARSGYSRLVWWNLFGESGCRCPV